MNFPLTQTLDKDIERTKVLYDSKDIVNSAIEMLSSVKEKIDVCADHNAPSSHVELRPIWNAFPIGDRPVYFTELGSINQYTIIKSIIIVKPKRKGLHKSSPYLAMW